MTADAADYAEYLTQQARSDIAVVHEFKLRFMAEDKSLHLFFEGEEDPAFYLPEIRRISTSNIWPYVCDGKPKLRAVRQSLIDDGYLSMNCLFFVDRDYDDFFGTQISEDERTFITQTYSIENYLVSAANADIVLVDLAGMARSDPEYKAFHSKFSVLVDRFAQKCRPLIALCLAYRASGGRPNLNNASMHKVFQVRGSLEVEAIGIGRREFKRAVFPLNTSVSFGSVRDWIRRLDMSRRQEWLRGKYELWFFQQLLFNFLQLAAQQRKAKKQRLVRIPAALQTGAMFELLGGRIGICPFLAGFLERTIRSNTELKTVV